MKFAPFLPLIAGLAVGIAAGVRFSAPDDGVANIPTSPNIPVKIRPTPHVIIDSSAPKSGPLIAILKEPNAYRGLKALVSYVDGLGAADFPNALAQLRVAADPHRQNALDLLVARWMEVDPQGAANAVVQSRAMEDHDLGTRMIKDVYDAWSAKDPDGALDDVQHTLSGDEQKTAFQAVLANIAKENPARALAVIKGRQGDGTSANLKIIFTAWAADNPAAATQAMLQIAHPDQRHGAIAGILADFIKEDPQSALAWVNSLPQGKAHGAAMGELANQWGEADPAAAMAWFDTTPDYKGKSDLQDMMALHWANRDAIGEFKHAVTMPGGSERDSMLSWSIGQLTYDDARAAARAVESLPAPLKKQATISLINSWTDYDPAAAAAYLSALPEGETKRDSIYSVASSWSRTDPASTAKWLNGQNDSHEKAEATGEVVDQWMQTDPTHAAAWATQLPAGPVHDSAAIKMSERTSTTDLPASEKWAQSIGDPKDRAEQLNRVYSMWLTADRTAATRAIENSALPAEAKKTLLHQ